MQELHLIGVQGDGEHLLLSDDYGGQFRLRLDDALRRAARLVPRTDPTTGQVAGLRLGPRAVQAMIRAGASSAEAAERAGWSLEKVHRFDGPILAEREHIATTASRVRLRGRHGEPGTTLADRVTERLAARGVAPDQVSWDSRRSEDGRWTVAVGFAAGGSAREATWAFSRGSGTIQALDDEALWLSTDDVDPQRAGVGPARAETSSPLSGQPAASADAHSSTLSQDAALTYPATSAADAPFEVGEHEDPFDLGDSVRQRSSAARRRGAALRRTPPFAVTPARVLGTSPSDLPPVTDPAGREALPLADLRYDPETMPPPPGAHSEPHPDGADGRPEPAAAEAASHRRPPRPRSTGKPARPRARGFVPPQAQIEGPEAVEIAAQPSQDASPRAEETPLAARTAALPPADAEANESAAPPELPQVAASPKPRPPGLARSAGATSSVSPGQAETVGVHSIDRQSARGQSAPGKNALPEENAQPSVSSETVDEPQLPWDDESDPDRPSSAPNKALTATVETSPGQQPTQTGSRPKARPSVPSWDDIMFGSRGKD